MNEEMRNEEMETVETVENEEVVVAKPCDEVSESGGGLLKFVAVTICAAGAAGAYLYKTRKQRKQTKINKMITELERNGYTVLDVEDYSGSVEDISEDQVETEEVEN